MSALPHLTADLATQLQTAWLRRGPLAWALWPLAALHGLILFVRRLLYRCGLVRTHRLPVPVVVVGNLIVGGAGKTPTLLALIELLRQRGFQPGVISRGYGRVATEGTAAGRKPVSVGTASRSTEVGDEPLLIHLRSRVPVVVCPDRVAAGQQLLREHPEVNVVLSDDGLQHWRLGRDVQVIVFDERGAGNGWLLPAGPLREHVPARCPARSIVVYNAPGPSLAWPGHVAQRELGGLVPLAAWWAGEPASLQAFNTLRGRRVLAAAGVARPQRFFDMLRGQGLTIDELPLPDHHSFATLPWPAGTAEVIVTEKDAVKLSPSAVQGTHVWVATLDFQLGPAFSDALRSHLPGAPEAAASASH